MLSALVRIASQVAVNASGIVAAEHQVGDTFYE